MCENNNYAIYSHIRERMPDPDPCARAASFRIPAERIEHGDIQRIFEAAQRALAAIRSGDGPRFIECMTYRWRDHVGPDEDRRLRYRPDAELDQWIARDELPRIGAMLPPAVKREIEGSVEAEISDAIDFAEAAEYPADEELYAHVFRP